MPSVGFALASLQLTLNIFESFFYHSVFIAHFEQVNADYVRNMYISCRLKNNIPATTEIRKGATLCNV